MALSRRATITAAIFGGLLVLTGAAGVLFAQRALSTSEQVPSVGNDMSNVQADLDALTVTDPDVSLSSNPYDYALRSPALRRLIAHGTPALPAINARLRQSTANGLNEYLLSIAAERITKVDIVGGPKDSPLREISTAKEWPDAWARYSKSVPTRARQIFLSNMAVTEKNRELTALGTPALPLIIDSVAEGHDEFSPAAEALLQGCQEVGGATNIHVTPQWARGNAGKFDALRQMTQ